MIQTRYNHQRCSPEKVGGPSPTEKVGYISAKQRIENLILAGQRLNYARMEQYDFPEGTDIDENIDVPPVRRLDYDLAEATMEQNRIRQKYAARATKVTESVDSKQVEAGSAANEAAKEQIQKGE